MLEFFTHSGGAHRAWEVWKSVVFVSWTRRWWIWKLMRIRTSSCQPESCVTAEWKPGGGSTSRLAGEEGVCSSQSSFLRLLCCPLSPPAPGNGPLQGFCLSWESLLTPSLRVNSTVWMWFCLCDAGKQAVTCFDSHLNFFPWSPFSTEYCSFLILVSVRSWPLSMLDDWLTQCA